MAPPVCLAGGELGRTGPSPDNVRNIEHDRLPGVHQTERSFVYIGVRH